MVFNEPFMNQLKASPKNANQKVLPTETIMKNYY